MPNLASASLAALAAATLFACGGDPGGDDDTGTGSNTLRVDADLEASPEVANAVDASDFTTDFHVDVEKNGVEVTTGEVVVVSDGGEVALVYDDGDGRWRGVQAGYYRSYQLHVTSGDDFVHGVQLTGPDIHVFVTPDGSAAVDASAPLVVTWDREVEATSATIETDRMDRLAIADTGTFEIPVGGLESNDGEPTDEEIRLERATRLVPSGAVGDSEVRVRIENRLPVLVAATAP